MCKCNEEYDLTLFFRCDCGWLWLVLIGLIGLTPPLIDLIGLIGFQVVEKIGASTVFDSVMPGSSSNRGHVDGDGSFDRLCV